MVQEERRELAKNPNLAVMIVLVSVLSIINTVLVYFPTTDPALVDDVLFFRWFLEVVFVFNFLYRLVTAGSRLSYLKSIDGITDLLACVPFIEVAWIFRGAKAITVLRGMGYEQFKRNLSKERAEAIVYLYVFVIFLVLEFGSYGVLVAERSDPSATIKTTQDAIWYSYVTITTVGYGDFVPYTLAGRVIGSIIMTMGIGTYAILIGYFARRLVVGRKEREEEKAAEKMVTIDAEEMTRHQQEMEKSIKELSEKLGHIEQQIAQRQQDDRK